jgi:ribosomal protein S18 acetylase RimI-like enzyme
MSPSSRRSPSWRRTQKGWPATSSQRSTAAPLSSYSKTTGGRRSGPATRNQNIHHPWGTADELASRFPSHMHIDLLPRIQARGIGRKLINTLVADLRDKGSPGLHLIVGDGNPEAVGFYRHVGFAEVSAEHLYPVTGLHIFVMDLRA